MRVIIDIAWYFCRSLNNSSDGHIMPTEQVRMHTNPLCVADESGERNPDAQYLVARDPRCAREMKNTLVDRRGHLFRRHHHADLMFRQHIAVAVGQRHQGRIFSEADAHKVSILCVQGKHGGRAGPCAAFH